VLDVREHLRDSQISVRFSPLLFLGSWPRRKPHRSEGPDIRRRDPHTHGAQFSRRGLDTTAAAEAHLSSLFVCGRPYRSHKSLPAPDLSVPWLYHFVPWFYSVHINFLKVRRTQFRYNLQGRGGPLHGLTDSSEWMNPSAPVHARA
jgi:hypothetical protein